MRVGNREVRITHREKVLFPRDGITKGDLIDYYHRVSGVMLPHLRGRPVSMQRFPDGIEEHGFYHKDAPYYFPDWIRRVPLEKQGGGVVDYVICDDAATLVYLANQNCITPHVFLSRTDRIDAPDRLIFDLDPTGDDFSKVIEGAKALREELAAHGLIPFVMTTGSRGLHVTAPLDRTADFDEARAFAQGIARTLVERHPDRYTLEQRISKRGKLLFLDTLRNSYAATAVPPYAVRPKPGASVATPLDWAELDDPRLTPQRYTLRNLFERLDARGDPWAEIDRHQGAIRSRRRKAA